MPPDPWHDAQCVANSSAPARSVTDMSAGDAGGWRTTRSTTDATTTTMVSTCTPVTTRFRIMPGSSDPPGEEVGRARQPHAGEHHQDRAAHDGHQPARHAIGADR